ncbi:MAG: MFS transporter [Candidatus Eisenbacteria bacterium]
MIRNRGESILGKDRLPPSISVILLLELVSLGATIPVIAYYVRSFGGSAFHVTLCFFLTAAPKIFLQPLWGGLSDRIGRKPVMLFSLAGSLVSYGMWAYAPSFGNTSGGLAALLGLSPALFWLLASRAMFGLFGAQLTLGASVVADCLPSEQRARGMGILGATAGIGFIIGPILGGIVAAHVSYAAVGWMNVALEALALVIALAALPETAPRNAEAVRRIRKSAARVWRLALAHRSVGRLLGSVLIGTTGLSVIQGTLVVLAEDRWGYDVMQTGKLLSVFFLVGAAVQGGGLRPLVPRFGELNLARAGYLMIAAGLAALIPGGHYSVLWISLFLISIGIALSTPTVTSLLSSATHEEDQGRVQGLNQGVTGLGRSISGVSMGGLYDAFGPAAPFGSSSVLVLIALGILLVYRKPETETLFHPNAVDPPGTGAGISGHGAG